MDNRSAYVNKLQEELRMAFPQYLGIFSKVTTNTSLTLLEKYTSPSAFIKADKQELIDTIISTACFGLTYAQNKYDAIFRLQMMQRNSVTSSTVTSNVFVYISVSFANMMKKSIVYLMLCMSLSILMKILIL